MKTFRKSFEVFRQCVFFFFVKLLDFINTDNQHTQSKVKSMRLYTGVIDLFTGVLQSPKDNLNVGF